MTSNLDDHHLSGTVATAFAAILMCIPVELTTAAPPEATVEVLLKAGFDRVVGRQAGGAVLFPDNTSDWFEHTVASPTVDFDGQAYRMWFVGLTMTGDEGIPYGFYERIGLATSRDGIDWKVANGSRPVLDLGPAGQFDDVGLSHPFVLRVDDHYMMWYGGIDGRTGADVGVGPGHVRIEQIGLATSTDGIHWTRANNGDPVLEIGPPDSIDAVQATGCHVIRRGDEFVMWYGAYNGVHTIGLATSPDGIHWTKEKHGKNVSGLRGTEQLGPSVYFDGRRYLMLYNTALASDVGKLWSIFAATSDDGFHWEPALGHQPLLGAATPGNFGSADGVHGNNHAVHPTKLIFFDSRVRVWYGAEADKPALGASYPHGAIGLMEAVIE